jgi:hypothetical protein
LTETNQLSALDTKRFKELAWKARQLRARVHEHVTKFTARPWTRRVLDLNVDAEAAYIVGHDTSVSLAE